MYVIINIYILYFTLFISLIINLNKHEYKNK